MNRAAHIVIVGCLIRRESGELLLIRHHRRGWEIPQGHVEEGEDLIAAVHREVREETGLTIELGPLASVWSKITSPPALILNFLATPSGGELTPSPESPELGWFPPNEALDLVEHPANRDRLHVLLEHEGVVSFHSYATSPYRVL